ncbi:unnamed protein product [Boreogadus saida]
MPPWQAYRAILKQPLKSVREILVNQTAHKCWPATARTVPAPLPAPLPPASSSQGSDTCPAKGCAEFCFTA